MVTIDAIRWFKKSFGAAINAGVANTPFTLDLITTIAVQESYEVWGRAYRRLSADDVLQFCTGDVISAPKRGVFPRTKEELLGAKRGAEMFDIAHDALVRMAKYAPEYAKYAANPNRFCHAFGIFQYDMQFYKNDSEFFLDFGWYTFDPCLTRCVTELEHVKQTLFGPSKKTLSDSESVYVAIGYNMGARRVRLQAGFKQGYRDSSGKYYGEHVADYLRLVKAVDT